MPIAEYKPRKPKKTRNKSDGKMHESDNSTYLVLPLKASIIKLCFNTSHLVQEVSIQPWCLLFTRAMLCIARLLLSSRLRHTPVLYRNG